MTRTRTTKQAKQITPTNNEHEKNNHIEPTSHRVSTSSPPPGAFTVAAFGVDKLVGGKLINIDHDGGGGVVASLDDSSVAAEALCVHPDPLDESPEHSAHSGTREHMDAVGWIPKLPIALSAHPIPVDESPEHLAHSGTCEHMDAGGWQPELLNAQVANASDDDGDIEATSDKSDDEGAYLDAEPECAPLIAIT